VTRFLILALCLLIACSLVAVSPAAAGDHPQSRTGFFVGLGLGWGNMGADLGSVEVDRQNSVSGNLRFGWSVANNLALGLEVTSWSKNYEITTNQDLNLTAGVTTFALTYFPGNMGLFVRGGLGFSSARTELKSGSSSVDHTENGLGFLGAVGYEWRLTNKFALGPQVQWAYLNIEDQVLESLDFMSVTAQATWYW
jgi:hypothetical protein